MDLKLYVDRMSQPSRALIIFCKMNKIDFEEVTIDLAKGQHRSTEFKVMPSSAILLVLSRSSRPLVYPADLVNRAKINSVLDWHHSNLRRGSAFFVLNSTLAPALGLPLNPQAASDAKKLLVSSLSNIESIWLKGDAKFLVGNPQPSIADLSLVCEIMQLEVVNEKDRQIILEPHKKILNWIENVKAYMSPYFEEVHQIVYIVRERLQSNLSSTASSSAASD